LLFFEVFLKVAGLSLLLAGISCAALIQCANSGIVISGISEEGYLRMALVLRWLSLINAVITTAIHNLQRAYLHTPL
jgi:hypothetical protein